MIKSPYNFVPAPPEKEVFKPDWADQVSHDIPFSDGESGEIEFTITAETPIFIRNGHAKPPEGKRPTEEFSHFVDKDEEKHYFIPATSIKGMLRNVMEIMSFSKLKIDPNLDSNVYGLRDMANDLYSKKEIRGVSPGWLFLKNGGWKIAPASYEGRISLQTIKTKFNLSNDFLIPELPGSKKIAMLGSSINETFRFKFVKELKKGAFKYGDLYDFDDNGRKSGKLVLFGNIGGKHYDFIFGEKKEEEYDISHELIENTKKTFDTIESSEFDFYSKLKEIPVFFKIENGHVKHFGLSKLYRLNNAKKLREFTHEYKKDFDLVETIFGTTEGRGRVFFSHAKAKRDVKVLEAQARVLSTPRPSFYPNYLNQPSSLSNLGIYYNTYHSNPESVKIRGFKRYPVQINAQSIDKLGKDKIVSFLQPLSPKTTFSSIIRFHNLRPIEIGALISSLSFHGEDGKYHNIGGAKPYGFGKINIELKDKEMWLKYLHYFEIWAESKKSEWLSSPQIVELMAMGTCPSHEVNSRLIYPKLEPKNEFSEIKKQPNYLKSYSELSKYTNQVSSKIDMNSPEVVEAEIKKQEEIQTKILDQPDLEDEFSKYSDLSIYLNAKFNEWTAFKQRNQEWIVSKIKELYNNHRCARRPTGFRRNNR